MPPEQRRFSAPRSTPAAFLAFQWLAVFLLLAELARLTSPMDFLWVRDSAIWTEGRFLADAILAAGAILLVVAPRLADLVVRSGPPLVLALGMALNLSWGCSLAWWVVIAAGLGAWGGWLLELALCRRARFFLPVWAVGNYLLLGFLLLDARFLVATNSHLGFTQLWYACLRGGVEAGGIPPGMLTNLWQTAAGFVIVTVVLGYLLRDRLPYPNPLATRLALAFLLSTLHVAQFDVLAGMVPMPTYLTFRFQFGTGLVPQASRFRIPAFREAVRAIPPVDVDACYRPGRFAWRSSSRPNLFLVIVESWRSDFLPTTMPALARRAREALWLRNHYTQANSTAPALAALLHGCLPVDFLARFGGLGEPAFLTFLRESGYHLTFLYGSEDQIGGIQPLVPKCRGISTGIPPDDWPGQVDAILAQALEILEKPGPHLVVGYLYNTHFDYRYPPEFERFTPVLPRGTEILNLSDDPEAVRGVTNHYRNALTFLDDRLERFFRRRAASPAAAGSWVVLVGDHGESLGDAGFFAHATGPHLSQFHVPCLIFGPDLTPEVIDWPSEHVDLLPTLGPLLGFEVTGLTGRNARLASSPAVLSFDFSGDQRIILRTSSHMSLFDLDRLSRFHWVLTTRNDFSLDLPLLTAYLATQPVALADLVRTDAEMLRNRFAAPRQDSPWQGPDQ